MFNRSDSENYLVDPEIALAKKLSKKNSKNLDVETKEKDDPNSMNTNTYFNQKLYELENAPEKDRYFYHY